MIFEILLAKPYLIELKLKTKKTKEAEWKETNRMRRKILKKEFINGLAKLRNSQKGDF